MAPFAIIFTGQIFSLLGSRLVQFAIVWWLTASSGSASVLALGSIMALLPQVIIGPFAGALIDRWNRRIVMIVSDAVIALAVVVLAVLYAWGAVSVWHIYALMFVRSACGAFHWNAMSASTKMLVPEKHLSRVSGLNRAVQGVAGFVAPPLGALLMEVVPIQGILAIDVVTAAIAIAPLFVINIPQPEAVTNGKKPSLLTSMREGFGYIRTKRGIMLIIFMAMAINFLLTPAFSLLPIMVTNHFKGGALELAWLQSASGVGVILGGLTLGVWGGFKRRTVTSLLALILNGVFLAVMGGLPASMFPFAVGANFLAGFMNPIVNGPLMALLQSTVPPEMQGRVFALIGSGTTLMTPIGLAMAGPITDHVGVPIWFLIGGLTMAVMGAGAFFVPAIVNLED